MSFEFSWRALPEGFTKWMFVNLITDLRGVDGTDGFDKLSDLTNSFTDVKITMQVNGMEVNAQTFVESVERALNGRAEQEAKRLLETALPSINKLEQDIDNMQDALKRKLSEFARDNGLEMYWDD